MQELTDLNKQHIELTVLGCDLAFNVNRTIHNDYVNAVTQNSKVAPSHNFLMCAVTEDNKDTLRDILKKTPGAEVHLAGAVLEQYMPDLDIVVKKPKPTPSK